MQSDLQNLEDASDDLLLVEDESAPIPFVVGEVFVHFNMEETKVVFPPHLLYITVEKAYPFTATGLICRRNLKKPKPR